MSAVVVTSTLISTLLLSSGSAKDTFASETQVQGIDSELAARFAALRGARPPGDLLRERRPDGIESAAGANRAIARRVDDGKSRVAVWLIPGRQSLCLLVRLNGIDSGETCRAIGGAQTDLLMTLSGGRSGAPGLRPNEVVVAGVVPDGSSHVVLTMMDGRRQGLPVVNNGYSAAVDGATESVSYVTGDGQTVMHDAPSYARD